MTEIIESSNFLHERKIVVLDADYLSAFFISRGKLLFLDLYQNLQLPTQVYNELKKPKSSELGFLTRLDSLIQSGKIKKVSIDAPSEEIKLYSWLVDDEGLGKGEAAALVIAKSCNGILASNNLKDVAKYVEMFGLEHITTARTIKLCEERSIISLEEAEKMWRNMKSSQCTIKLPGTYKEFKIKNE